MEGYSSSPAKCRGQFWNLSPEQQTVIQARCQDPSFATKPMLFTEKELVKLWPDAMRHHPYMPPLTPGIVSLACDMVTAIEHDRQEMVVLGMTHAQLGNVLKTLMRLAIHKKDVHFDSTVSLLLARPLVARYESILCHIDKRWSLDRMFESTFAFNGQILRVFVILWGGEGRAQECPFQDKNIDKEYYGHKYGAGDVVVTNVTTGAYFKYSTLLPHMIKHHGFLEGLMLPYRVEPRDVFQVIGALESDKSYAIASKKNIACWTLKKTEVVGEAKLMRNKFDEGEGEGEADCCGDGYQIIHLRQHTAFISGNKMAIVPASDCSFSDAKQAAGLSKIGITEADLPVGAIGTSNVYERTPQKTYSWSAWLPESVDGPIKKSC